MSRDDSSLGVSGAVASVPVVPNMRYQLVGNLIHFLGKVFLPSEVVSKNASGKPDIKDPDALWSDFESALQSDSGYLVSKVLAKHLKVSVDSLPEAEFEFGDEGIDVGRAARRMHFFDGGTLRALQNGRLFANQRMPAWALYLLVCGIKALYFKLEVSAVDELADFGGQLIVPSIAGASSEAAEKAYLLSDDGPPGLNRGVFKSALSDTSAYSLPGTLAEHLGVSAEALVKAGFEFDDRGLGTGATGEAKDFSDKPIFACLSGSKLFANQRIPLHALYIFLVGMRALYSGVKVPDSAYDAKTVPAGPYRSKTPPPSRPKTIDFSGRTESVGSGAGSGQSIFASGDGTGASDKEGIEESKDHAP